MSTLTGVQDMSEDEYECQLKRIGSYRLPKYPVYKLLSADQIAELARLANYVSDFAFNLVNVRTPALLSCVVAVV